MRCNDRKYFTAIMSLGILDREVLMRSRLKYDETLCFMLNGPWR